MKARWEKLGAKLGIGVCLAGFGLIFFGWNGAASVDRVPSQFPYLISGGLAGLALVVIGAVLIVVETSRDEREQLRNEVTGLRETVNELLGVTRAAQEPGAFDRARKKAAAPTPLGRYVAGASTYHLPTCRLLEGRGDLPRIDADGVARLGLAACRVCEPASAAKRSTARR